MSATIPAEMVRRFHLAPGDRVQAIETEHGILLLLPPSIPPCRKRIGPLSRIHPFSDGNKRSGILVAVVLF